MAIKHFIVRLACFSSIIIGILLLLILEDILSYNENLQSTKSDDAYTFENLGINVISYGSDRIKLFQEDLPTEYDNLLLIRTSQLLNGELANILSEFDIKGAIVLCDTDWSSGSNECNSENFISELPSNRIVIEQTEDLAVGYLEISNYRVFILPEQLVQNLNIYPNLAEIISGISHSQHIVETQIANKAESQNKTGFPLLAGGILSIIIFNAILAITLVSIFTKLSQRLEIIRGYAPFISIIPTGVLTVYVLIKSPYLRTSLEEFLNDELKFLIENYHDTLWIILTALFLSAVFYIGFEISIRYSKYFSRLFRRVEHRTNKTIVRYAIAIFLSIALLQMSRNTLVSLPKSSTELIIFGFFLYILHLIVKNKPYNPIKIPADHRISKILDLKWLSYLLVGVYILFILFSSFLLQQRSLKLMHSKNALFFNPPRDYLIAPYNKIIKNNDVYHEYNVTSSEPIWIDKYLISHPEYTDIKYSINPNLNPSQPVGYPKGDEPALLTPILKSSHVIESYLTDESSQYFVLTNKTDLSAKFTFKLTLLCNNNVRRSNINLEKFRLSYDRQSTISSTSTLNTTQKCTYGKNYSRTIVRSLSDISTYADNDEIFKLSSDNKILNVEVIYDDSKVNFNFLNLQQEGDYIFAHFPNNNQLTILSQDQNENELEFIKENGNIDIAESVNELRLRRLIPNTITIHSLNKYTLIKYIK